MSNSTQNSSTTQNSQRIVAAHALDPWLLWVAFRRNCIWSTLFGAILASIGAFIVHSFFIPEYRATHILEANREYVVFQGILQAPVDLVQNEKPLIYNQLVLGPVLSNAKICEAPSLADPITRESNLRKNMSVSDAGSRTLLQVSYKDTDPIAAAMVCNAIVRSYLQQRQRFDDRRVSDLEGWLQPAVDLWQGEVEEHRKKIVALSKQAKGFDPFQESSRINADTKYLNSLLDELSSLRSEEAALEAELAMMKNAEKIEKPVEDGEPDADQIEELVATQPEVVRISTLISQKRADMSSMERKELVQIRQGWYDQLAKEIDLELVKLSKAKEAARTSIREILENRIEKSLVAQRSSALITKANALSSVRTRRDVFQSNYEAEDARLSNFAGETAELYFAQLKYHQATSILVKLNERVASIRTERQKSSTIQTLAEAVPPTYPEESIPWKRMLIVAGIAFVIPFGFGMLNFWNTALWNFGRHERRNVGDTVRGA